MEELIYKILPAVRMIFLKNGNSNISFLELSDTSVLKDNKSISRFLKNCLWVNAEASTDEKLSFIQKELSNNKSVNSICFEGAGCVIAGKSAYGVSLMINALISLLNNEDDASLNFDSSNDPVNSETLIQNKIVVVTGGAQGFGEGIVRDMFSKKANVVILDVKKEKGIALAEKLNSTPDSENCASFVSCDVSDELSVKKMIESVVLEFGGIDVFVSNAGILRAGDLDEFDVSDFELMTKINYSGYFVCTKYASKIMKQQHKYAPDYFMDIIQINSKSGLQGSNKNFCYAGGKFGGIGLTQSFALELMPYNIKVNSICPGNFFDGPLWADSENGLFVQYLRAGKVKGAKTIEDVKKFYENIVPAKRGCTVKDVMKAIYYVIDQEYETGQAIPVTGGQIMLK